MEMNQTPVRCDNKGCSLRRQTHLHKGPFPPIPPDCGVCHKGVLIPLDQDEAAE